jgi:hypothetical protein
VETYLQDCILESIDKVADENAREEVKTMANKINDIAYEYEEKQVLCFIESKILTVLIKIFGFSKYRMDELESKRIVADLVHGFLLPETQKQVFREQGELLNCSGPHTQSTLSYLWYFDHVYITNKLFDFCLFAIVKHQMKPYLKAAHEEIYRSTNEVIIQKEEN